MEKYTIDIDKVLDDFEETEALNVNNKNKNVDSLQPSIFMNYDGNQIHVNQENTFEHSVNEDISVSLCDKNPLSSDKSKVSQNSVHNINCLQNFEKSKGSDRIICNSSENYKHLNFAIKSEISGCISNTRSIASVPVLGEPTDDNNHKDSLSLSADEDHKNEPFVSNGVKFENDNSSVCDPHSANESSEFLLVKDDTLFPPGNYPIKNFVFADKTCNLPLNNVNCDSEMEDHSLPSLKSCKEISNIESSSESNGSLIVCTDTAHSLNLNAFNNSSSSVLNEGTQDSKFTEMLNYDPQTIKDGIDVKSNVEFIGSEDKINEVEMPISVSNLNGVENEQLNDFGMHYAHIDSELNGECLPGLKKQNCNVESLAALSSAAAENLVLHTCGCKRGHLPNECSHQEMHALEDCAAMQSNELEDQRSGAEDSQSASNLDDEENPDLNRCGCLGVHPPNVCFQQNGRVRAIPDFDERFSDNDDDSGVSSEEDNSPLFFFNNRMFNYNDGAQIDARNEEIIPAPNFACSSCDNNVNLQEAAISDINESVSSTPAVESKDDFLEILPSGSAVNCQPQNKFTGARSKIEVTSEIFINKFSAENVEPINTENIDLKSDVCGEDSTNECASETVLEESLHSNCDNSNKSINICSASMSSDIDSIEHAIEEEIKCDNQIVSASTDTLYVTADGECSFPHSDTKTDNFSCRLPRPTTLDLPSRHIAASKTSDESGTALSESDNLESLSSTDLIPNEKPTNVIASEESSSNKPQPQIGLVKPFWIPDAEAPNCMHCGVKFTVIKRRHHCRACGKVLCSRCCNLRAKLAYLNKEDRICHPCFEILSSTSQNESTSLADSQSSSSCGSSPNFSPSPQAPNSSFSDKNTWRPHPNNPDDYCSTIPPLQQVQLSEPRPPPTVLVPIGVLKRGNKARREPKQVIFSDGIRPGGDLTDLTEPADVFPVYRRMGRKRVERSVSGDASNVTGSPVSFNTMQRNKQKRILVSDEEGPLPPLVFEIDHDSIKDDKLDMNYILEKMQDDDAKPVNFALLKNMHLFVKLTKLDCCFGKECWCFTSHGLCAVGQDEVMVILERNPGENILPRGIIKLFTHIYDSASKGSSFEDLGHIIFPEPILGSCDHRGFLFVRPTFQCLSKLIVPNTPFLVAILIHKWEVPWAKVFPLRLMLRLGAECRYYPCALVSVRHRKPVFFEIGQTIMSVLADLRNFQFTIPVIPGLVVHMEEKKTCVNIPRNRYDKVMKVLNSNNVEHVLALGSNFSSEADSHLVCMQKEEGDYQTQAINIENTMRRVTGASFIVFSGALKSSSGLSAKFSIVEDGLLVQIPQETMVAIHMALRDMKDLTIQCGQINAAEPEEVVVVQWTRDDKKFNIGVRSPIDCKSLEGIPNLRIHNSTDYAGDNFLIRWTEVFFLEVDESGNSIQHELVDPCRLAETVAQSCCMALAPYLDQLAESELTKIGLRVTLDSERDRVEYDIGACGKPLPAVYMNALDCGLIPVILRLSGSAQSEPVSFELIFHILIK